MKIDKNKIISLLNKLSLNKSEIKLYLLLFDYDSLPIQELLKLTNLKRGNLYNTLYLLKQKNLIEEYIKNKKKHFRLLNPSELKKIVLDKQEKVKEISIKIDQILPTLINNFKITSNKPAVYYLEGLEGIKNTYQKILKEKKNIYIFTSRFEKNNPEFVKILNNQIKKQYLKNIKVYALSGKYYNKKEYLVRKKRMSYVKTIKNLSLDSEIIVFGKNIAITTFKNQDFFTTLIINKNISQTFKNIFQCLWNIAEDPKKYLKEKK